MVYKRCSILYIHITLNGILMLIYIRLKLLYLEMVEYYLEKKKNRIYNDEAIDSFNYFGITLNFNGKFTKTQKVIASQGAKCMGYSLRLCNNLSLNKETSSSSSSAFKHCSLWLLIRAGFVRS